MNKNIVREKHLFMVLTFFFWEHGRQPICCTGSFVEKNSTIEY